MTRDRRYDASYTTPRHSTLNGYHTEPVTPVGIMVLSVVIAVLVSLGSTFGGSLVYEYGFNVESAGDHPAWHKSEIDVFPGQHDREPPA